MSCLIFPALCLCSFWMNIEENSISLLQNPFFLGRREHREQDLNISRNLLWHKSSIFPFLFGFFVCSCGQKSWRIDLEMFVLIGQGMYFSSGTGIIFLSGVPWLCLGIWEVRKSGLSWTEPQDFPVLGLVTSSPPISWNPAMISVGRDLKAHFFPIYSNPLPYKSQLSLGSPRFS